MKSLIGLYFIRHDDADFFQTGKVASQASADHFFVCILRKEVAGAPSITPMELVSVDDFTGILEDGRAAYEFFDTREAVEAWGEWLQAPPPDATSATVHSIKRH